MRLLSRSHTKSGPGRYHGQGSLYFVPVPGKPGTRLAMTKRPQQRLKAPQGCTPFMTYAMHDTLKRIEMMQERGNVLWFERDGVTVMHDGNGECYSQVKGIEGWFPGYLLAE